MLEISNAVMALVSLILTLIATVIGAFAYVTTRINKVQDVSATQLNRQREVHEANLNSLREVTLAKIEALGERESKQRHDLRNELQNLLGKQDADITVAQRNVDTMMRDVMKRSEIMDVIGQLRSETQSALERAEVQRTRTIERLAERIEAITLRSARAPLTKGE